MNFEDESKVLAVGEYLLELLERGAAVELKPFGPDSLGVHISCTSKGAKLSCIGPVMETLYFYLDQVRKAQGAPSLAEELTAALEADMSFDEIPDFLPRKGACCPSCGSQAGIRQVRRVNYVRSWETGNVDVDYSAQCSQPGFEPEMSCIDCGRFFKLAKG